MEDEKLEGGMTADTYLDQLREIKSGTVAKEEYDRIVEENRKLANAVANGLTRPEDEESKWTVDAASRAFRESKSDLEMFDAMLFLREDAIARGDRDPFLPTGKDYVPTDADANEAQRYADELKECVDASESDPREFFRQLERKCGGFNGRK